MRLLKSAGVLAVVAIVGFVSSAAMAAESGPYIGVRSGLAMLKDSNLGFPAEEAESDVPPLSSLLTFDEGFAVSGAGGYAFTSGLRLEGEIGYRRFDLDTLRFELGELDGVRGPIPVEAKVDLDGYNVGVSLMTGVYYDFDLGPGLKPYIGGGVGAFFISVNVRERGEQLAEDSDTVFAYHLGGGVGYDLFRLNDKPVTLSLDYRFFNPTDPTFTDVEGDEFKQERMGHYIGAGLRIMF